MTAIAIPAPIGGWNARDALGSMEPTDAIKMVNWIPRAGYVQSRAGYGVHVPGLGGPVETLAPYRGLTEKLIAAANGHIWNVTSTNTSLASGFTEDRWQYTNHSTKLIFVNGADAPQVYDGSTVAAANFTGSPGGFTASTMWGVNSFKGRVYYWGKLKQSFWYAAAGAYQGTLAEYNMASVLTTGGTLV